MRGRKPKPSHLRLLEGNPGHRPVNKDEPKLKPRLPNAPSDLSDQSKVYWRMFGRQLLKAGVMTSLDGTALRLLVDAWAHYKKAMVELEKTTLVVKSPSGYPMQNPYLNIANKKLEQVQKLLGEFGMTPSTRTRVVVADPGTKNGARGIRGLIGRPS